MTTDAKPLTRAEVVAWSHEVARLERDLAEAVALADRLMQGRAAAIARAEKAEREHATFIAERERDAKHAELVQARQANDGMAALNDTLRAEVERLTRESKRAEDVVFGDAVKIEGLEDALAAAIARAEQAEAERDERALTIGMLRTRPTEHEYAALESNLAAAIAEHDLANAMHEEASRQRDACAAESVRLRDALANVKDRCPPRHAGGADVASHGKRCAACVMDAALAAPSASAATLDAKLAEARREQAETDHTAWLAVIRDERDVAYPPTDGLAALAERDARVRAAALEEAARECDGYLSEWGRKNKPDHREALDEAAARIRALAAAAPSAPAKERCGAISHGSRGVADGVVCEREACHGGFHEGPHGAMFDRIASAPGTDAFACVSCGRNAALGDVIRDGKCSTCAPAKPPCLDPTFADTGTCGLDHHVPGCTTCDERCAAGQCGEHGKRGGR